MGGLVGQEVWFVNNLTKTNLKWYMDDHNILIIQPFNHKVKRFQD